MTLQECYAALEGDYQGVLGRLTSERMVQKFVLKFLNDGSYDLLLRSMAEENWQEAFTGCLWDGASLGRACFRSGKTGLRWR